MTTEAMHIYGPSFSNFVRSVMLVCEEKNTPYSVGFEVAGKAVEFKGEQHLKWHPFGKIPVLIENPSQQDKLTLPETASICRYLDADKALQPSNSKEYAHHDALCAVISIDIDKILVREYLMEFAFPKGEDNSVRFDVVNKLQAKVAATLTVIENILNKDNSLSAEQFSIADALLVPMLHYLSCLPAEYSLIADFPNIKQYLAKLMIRPSCQKVLIAKKL
ncbi:MAG: glutathione S-transferase family protein [Colwellia sp.]|nr:glutathione S-transferase family protein [Colwellia sp.]